MEIISTILWDVGGVLLTNGWDHQQRTAVLARFALDRDDFERLHAEVDEAWEKDEISADEYLQHTVFYQPRSFTQAGFLDAMRDQSALLDDSAVGILRGLAASDEQEYVLATVNNESRIMNEFRLAKFDLLELYDAFFSSCYVGLRKPDRKVYQLALDVLQRDPEEVVFIDDRAENAAAAASLGIHAICYKGSAQLAEDLARLGVSAGQSDLHGRQLREA
jgi:putative hydrolase of the HAD superfamily